MIDRRQFLRSVPTAALLAAQAKAQTPDKLHRLAVLSPSQYSAGEISAHVLPELAKLGFVEGGNLAVTMHVGPPEDLPRLAREALATRPDAVIASTNAAVQAILALSSTVPIVMAFVGEDPVAAGLAKSLARPGGNVTGLTNQVTQLDGKRLSLLHEAVPSARRFAILAVEPPRHVASIAEMRRVAQSLGLETHVFHAHDPAGYPAAFAAMRAAQVEAMANAGAPEYVRDAAILAQHALDAGLPSIGELARTARDGYLLGYGPDSVAFRRRAADFVARILRGIPPGELGIEQPTTFEFAVNLKTARRLGIEISPTILLRADEVIE
jgi:putative tryptophan/tyrosine transport system substrate-binding protein